MFSAWVVHRSVDVTAKCNNKSRRANSDTFTRLVRAVCSMERLAVTVTRVQHVPYFNFRHFILTFLTEIFPTLSQPFPANSKILTNKIPTRCHLLFLFYFLETQHVSGINIPIFRNFATMLLNYHIGRFFLDLLYVGIGVRFG